MVHGGPDAGEPLRERLLKVSVRLFAEHGYEHTSVQQIVAAAGVTKGGLYHHVSSKDHVLHEIYHRLLAEQHRRLQRYVESDGPAIDRLRAAAVDLVETSAENVEDFAVFFRSMSQLSGDRLAEVRAERRRYFDAFRGLVVEAQRAGDLRRDVSAGVAVHSFIGSLSAIPTWYRPDGGLTYREIGMEIVEILFGGIRLARR